MRSGCEALAACLFRLSLARSALQFFLCLPRFMANEKISPHPGGLHTNIAQADAAAASLFAALSTSLFRAEKSNIRAKPFLCWVQLLRAN